MDGGRAPLEQIARAVPSCSIEAKALERVGSFGMLLGITSAVCPEGSLSGDLGVALASDVDADPGSVLTGEAWLIPLSDDRSDQIARRAGAVARVRLREVEVHGPRGGLHRVAANVRASLNGAAAGIAKEPAGLVAGLTIGDTTGIEPLTVERFRDSGLAHLVAVSGSNVAIVVAAAALAVRNASLRARAAFSAICLLVFVAVVGPEPSVLRAAAMGSLALIALVTGRRSEPIAALGIATASVVAFRPEMVYSAGLHLSVAATAGIVLFSARLARGFSFLPRPVAVVLGATLGAQIAVAPVLVATFGEISLVAPVANLVAAPAVAPATVLGLGAALAHGIWPPLGRLVMRGAEPFARWILEVADVCGSLSFASVGLPRIAGFLLALPVGACAVVALRRRVG